MSINKSVKKRKGMTKYTNELKLKPSIICTIFIKGEKTVN